MGEIQQKKFGNNEEDFGLEKKTKAVTGNKIYKEQNNSKIDFSKLLEDKL